VVSEIKQTSIHTSPRMALVTRGLDRTDSCPAFDRTQREVDAMGAFGTTTDLSACHYYGCLLIQDIIVEEALIFAMAFSRAVFPGCLTKGNEINKRYAGYHDKSPFRA
jgi:hypothetical protein